MHPYWIINILSLILNSSVWSVRSLTWQKISFIPDSSQWDSSGVSSQLSSVLMLVSDTGSLFLTQQMSLCVYSAHPLQKHTYNTTHTHAHTHPLHHQHPNLTALVLKATWYPYVLRNQIKIAFVKLCCSLIRFHVSGFFLIVQFVKSVIKSKNTVVQVLI